MNIVSQAIISYYQTREKKFLEPRFQRRLEERLIHNRSIEKSALRTRSSICTFETLEKLEGRADIEELKTMMGNDFYNINVMKVAGCNANAFFYGLSSKDTNIATVANLKSTISGLKQIGDESVSGYALKADANDMSGLVVVKVPRKKESETDLIHELFVGLYGINKMRRYVPNFAMVYGGFKCSRPIINPATKEVESFCDVDSPDKFQCVLYESIIPSKSFADFILECSPDDFIDFYLQACLSTDMAASKIGYTSYDAHNGNWLKRSVKFDGHDYFAIKYKDPRTKKESYVVTHFVATAIDYGYSTINHQGVDIGSNHEWLAPYIEEGPWPLYDAYKLLMFSAQTLATSKATDNRATIYEMIQKIFRFFNSSESLASAVNLQSKFYYQLPKTDVTGRYTIGDLVEHIKKAIDVSSILVDEPDYPILECGTCLTLDGAFELANPTSPIPKTFFEFYDYASAVSKSKNYSQKYKKLVDSFDYQSAREKFISKVDADFVEMIKHADSIGKIPDFKLETMKLMVRPQSEKLMAGIYANLFGAISEYEHVDLWLKVGLNVARLFKDRDLVEYIKSKRSDLGDYDESLLSAIKILSLNYRYIRAVAETQEWVKKYHSKFPWYRLVSGEIISLEDRFKKDTKDLHKDIPLPSELIEIEKPRSRIIPNKTSFKIKTKPDGTIEEIVV